MLNPDLRELLKNKTIVFLVLNFKQLQIVTLDFCLIKIK